MARILIILNTYFIQDLPIRLLSPQYLAQLYKKIDHKDKCTVCETYDDEVILKWDNHKFVKIVRLDKSNVPVLHCAPSNSKYNSIYKEINDDSHEPRSFVTHIILGNEEDSFEINMDSSEPQKENEQRINVVEDDETIAEEEVLTTYNKEVPGEKAYV